MVLAIVLLAACGGEQAADTPGRLLLDLPAGAHDLIIMTPFSNSATLSLNIGAGSGILIPVAYDTDIAAYPLTIPPACR